MQTDAIDHGRTDQTVETAILTELESAPVSPTELKGRVQKRVRKLTPAAWKAALDELVATERIHRRSKLAKNGKPTKAVDSYALGAPPPSPPPPPPPEVLARDQILNALQDGALNVAELKKRARGDVPVAVYNATLAGLVSVRHIYARYKRTKNGSPSRTIESYVLGGPPPEEFIVPVLASWNQAKREAERAGVSEQRLVAALLAELQLTSVPQPETVGDDPELVLRSLRALVDREGSGALISMRKLRAAAQLPKNRFDAAMLQLHANDAIILHHHDYVASLSAQERADLLVDRHDNHYVGVALRGGS